MKRILSLFVMGLLLAIPAVSSAATYHYIDLTGNVVTIEAESAQDALSKANANNDVYHSGVKLDQGMLHTGESFAVTYQYVTAQGTLKTVEAASVDAAFILATDIAPNSGFLRLGAK